VFTFLGPLLVGFFFTAASAFTTSYSHRLGEKRARLVCIILRDVLGIPLWVIGYVMAAQADSPVLFATSGLSRVAGWLLVVSGGVVIVAGLLALRWRAAAPSLHDTLVTHGIYALIRHPLYSGMLLELAGIFLLVPTLCMLVACFLGGIWVMIQARLEETDLLQRQPAYREYMLAVPRFIPRLKSP